LLNPLRSGQSMMERIGKILGEDAKLGLIAPREQIPLQADRPVVIFGFSRTLDRQRADALVWLEDGGNRWVLLPRRALNDCFMRESARHVGRLSQQNWYLLRADQIAPACRS